MKLSKLYKRNTNPDIYYEEESEHNCGSFALGIDGWYCPYIMDNIDDDDENWQYTEYERANWITELVLEEFSREEIMEEVIHRDFEFILKTCPWLKQIGEDEIDERDRVIAYRLSLEIPEERKEFDVDNNTDFHFRVMIDGEWWEKNGNGPVHRVEDFDVWALEDWLEYDGPILYAKFVKQ